MKRSLTLLLLCSLSLAAAAGPSFLQSAAPGRAPVVAPALMPSRYRVLSVADAALKSWLFSLPGSPQGADVMELPTPDGGTRAFRVWQTPVMHPELAAKYPDIKTFTATALDNPGVSARLDYSPYGFRAMVFDGTSTFFIDPYGKGGEGYAIAYYRRDYQRPLAERMGCEVADEEEMLEAGRGAGFGANLKTHGTTRRTYRLAVSCTGEYSVAVAGANPTKAAVLAKIVTSVNRVSGVYEKEFAVTLQLIPNEDTLIFLDGTTDPFTNGNGSTMLGQNQTTVTARIGTANFDIGHVFSTGGGGVAVSGVCNSGNKARGVTGQLNPLGDPFDIDYVAHEMGHQFNAAHTFNAGAGAGSCAGNGVPSSAFEPGSGSTIMAYAGICGTANDLQPNSDPYFHARSLDQITTNLNTGSASGCPVGGPIATGNDVPVVAAFQFQDTLYIPLLTSFELTAPAVTNVQGSAPLTYCWEQYDAGNATTTFANTTTIGPLFRSFNPDTALTRVFPRLPRTVRNEISYLGEMLPTVARTMRFTLTVRDVFNGIGAFSWGEDTIRMRAVNTGAPFRVTSQGTGLPVVYIGNSTQTVDWDVAGTTAAPVSAPTVDIYYSLDSGYTYPYLLASATPNDGSQTVVIPNVITTAGRFKVKASDNVFFDLNDQVFAVTLDLTGIRSTTTWADGVQVYPVPAQHQLHIKAPATGVLSATLTNAVGQPVWNGKVDGSVTIQVQGLAAGIYQLRLTDEKNGGQVVKRVVIE